MRPAPLLLALLAACALGDQDVIYGGSLTPESGTCDPPGRATLTLRHRSVAFSPSSGVLTLTGTLQQDGRIEAALTRPGLDKSPYTMRLDAQRSGESITGTYRTPRCRYRVQLARTR